MQIAILSTVLKLLVLSLLFSLCCYAQDFNLGTFTRELSARQNRVEEFIFLKQTAKKLGIKNVYMFGGTAAAWAHYVRWDMQRELGIQNLQPHRFDYDYTNVFRSNQDFDVVIDGTIEQAEAFEGLIQKQFNYFSGTRPTWEVRLLNEKRADKESIMGFDFQNQHTDSHSTGLIEMLECEPGYCVRDVRDFYNSQNQFLLDVFEAKLHYYYSDQHHQTNRFKRGMNPAILSVIRYFTKAVQYELERRPEDSKTLQKIIDNFKVEDKKKWDSYVIKWLDKNAKKLIVNAVDMEFAENLLRKVGLRDKLINLGDKERSDSMSWWLNKQALKGKSVGLGKGRKASELFKANNDGNIILSHETNSFAAFESLTKAHDGEANVLISRTNIPGEAALYGEGHYTLVGRKGGRGTGITVRYILNPEARENHDFAHSGQMVILKNKAAVKVIFENINLSVVEYFRQLSTGLEFDKNDKGIQEKIKRRIRRKSKRLTSIEIKEVKQIVENDLGNARSSLSSSGLGQFVNLNVVKQWLDIPDSVNYTEILENALEIAEVEFIQETLNNQLLSSHWLKNNKSTRFIKSIIYSGHEVSIDRSEILRVLDLTGADNNQFMKWLENGGETSYKARKDWMQYLHATKPSVSPAFQKEFKDTFLEMLHEVLKYSEPVRSYGVHYNDYQKPWQALGMMYNLVSLNDNVDQEIIDAFTAADEPNHTLAMSYLIDTPYGLDSNKLIKYFMNIPNFSANNFVVRSIGAWDTSYQGNDLEKFINKHYKKILDQPDWADSFARYALARDEVIEMKSFPKWVDYYISKGNSLDPLFTLSLANTTTYINHPGLMDKWLTQYVSKHRTSSKTIQHVLKSSLLEHHEDLFDKWLKYFVDSGTHSSEIARFVLSHDNVINNYSGYESILLRFVQRGTHIGYLNKYVFAKINRYYSRKFFNHRNLSVRHLQWLLSKEDCSTLYGVKQSK